MSSCNVRRPKVVDSADFPIVTVVVIYKCAFVEERRIILEVSTNFGDSPRTIQHSEIFLKKTSNIVLFMKEG